MLDLVKYASDASPYRLLPRAVVMARDTDDVAKTLAYAREKKIPVTFRAGGTSLNGQGQTDGILIDVRRHWTGVEVEQEGERVAREARHRPREGERGARPVLAPNRARPGEHRHRVRRAA